MSNSILWSIPYHSWPSPAHYFTDGLALFWSIAMSGTILTSSFLFAILATIQTATGKVCQMLIFIWHCVLMKMMPAIKLYHLSDSLLLSLNPAHTISFNVPHLKDCSCSPITPFITSNTLSPVQWLV